MEDNEQLRATEIIKRLLRVDRFHKALIDAKVKSLGIHRSQHNTLMYLYCNQGANNQDDIAKAFEISPAAVAVTLKKLEAAQLIERVTRSDNSRAKEVRLTEKGREIIRKTKESFMSVDETITEGFSDEELEKLEEFLDRMAENMKKNSPELDELRFPGPEIKKDMKREAEKSDEEMV